MKTISPSATSKKNFASSKKLRIFAPLKIRSGIETAGSPVSLFYAHQHRKIKPSGLGSASAVMHAWSAFGP